MNEYSCCHLCPRSCGVDREAGQTGYCGESSQCRVAAILPHFGEEPCLTGTHGSGTVFFSGCSCGCFFCQNHQISHESLGHIISDEELLEALRELVAAGVHNLNFVTPDHFWPSVRSVCATLRSEGVNIPFLWNCSGYANASLVPEIASYMDVFLPDFKFADGELARLCMGDSRYPSIALKAIEAMVERTGFLQPWDTSGQIMASHGTLVRHLVLPGQTGNSLEALDILYSHFGPLLPISIMSQFQPMPECTRRGLFTRKLTPAEYRRVCEHACELGFLRVFTQIELGDDGFAPDFTLVEPFGKSNRPMQS